MRDDSGIGAALFFLGAIAVGIYVYWVGFNQAWYAWQYNVPSSKVLIPTKPKDCDFISAPLGAKNCHYEPKIWVWNSDAVLIDGDGITKVKFSTDTKTDKPIMSTDDGKTWQWYLADKLPDTNPAKPASANVTWYKVTE
jgi:hypothetical protein